MNIFLSRDGLNLSRGDAYKPLLTIILLLGFFLMMFKLSSFSFWIDEVNSIVNSRSWSELVSGLRDSGGHRASFYLLLYGWLSLGITPELLPRLSSIFLAFLTLPLLFLVSAKIFNRHTALLILFLYVIAPFPLEKVRMVRNYGLMGFLSILSLYLLLLALERKDSGEPAKTIWIGYAVCNSLLILSHPFGILVLVCQGIVPLVKPRPIPWVPLILCGGSAVATFGLMPLFFGSLPTSQMDFLAPPTWLDLTHAAYHVYGFSFWALGANLIFWLTFALTVLPRARRRYDHTRHWRYWLVFGWVVLSVGIMLGVSYTLQPVFETRYLMVMMLPLFMTLGWALNRIESRPVRLFMLTLVIGSTLISLVNPIFVEARPGFYGDWGGTAELISARGEPGDAVVLFPYNGRRGYELYVNQIEGGESAPPVFDPAAEPYFPGGGQLPPVHDPAAIQQMAQTYDRVWFVVFQNYVFGDLSYDRFLALQGEIEQHYEQVDGFDTGAIFIALYKKSS